MTCLQNLPFAKEVSPDDWSYMAYPQFLLLKSLCQLSQTTVSDSVKTFGRTKLIVPQVATESNFLDQCQTISNEFCNSTQDAFGRSLDLNSVLKQGDFLVSGLGSNFDYIWYNQQEAGTFVVPVPGTNRDEDGVYCTCYMESTCTHTVFAYLPDENSPKLRIPGWRAGCYTQNALFSSTFECYFNASCLELLRKGYEMPLNVQRLVSRNPSQFPPNTSVGAIIRRLLVDEWQPECNFTAYYSACAPSTCSYTIDEKRGFVVIVGTLVGIWGGLTKALDLIVPRAVHFFRTKGHQWSDLLLNVIRPNRVHTLQ